MYELQNIKTHIYIGLVVAGYYFRVYQTLCEITLTRLHSFCAALKQYNCFAFNILFKIVGYGLYYKCLHLFCILWDEHIYIILQRRLERLEFLTTPVSGKNGIYFCLQLLIHFFIAGNFLENGSIFNVASLCTFFSFL